MRGAFFSGLAVIALAAICSSSRADFTASAFLGPTQISRDFKVVPEPYALGLLTIGAAALAKKKRR